MSQNNSPQKKGYYMVVRGHTPGIYDNYEQAMAQTNGFTNHAYYKFLGSKEEADEEWGRIKGSNTSSKMLKLSSTEYWERRRKGNTTPNSNVKNSDHGDNASKKDLLGLEKKFGSMSINHTMSPSKYPQPTTPSKYSYSYLPSPSSFSSSLSVPPPQRSFEFEAHKIMKDMCNMANNALLSVGSKRMLNEKALVHWKESNLSALVQGWSTGRFWDDGRMWVEFEKDIWALDQSRRLDMFINYDDGRDAKYAIIVEFKYLSASQIGITPEFIETNKSKLAPRAINSVSRKTAGRSQLLCPRLETESVPEYNQWMTFQGSVQCESLLSSLKKGEGKDLYHHYNECTYKDWVHTYAASQTRNYLELVRASYPGIPVYSFVLHGCWRKVKYFQVNE